MTVRFLVDSVLSFVGQIEKKNRSIQFWFYKHTLSFKKYKLHCACSHRKVKN